MGPPPESDAVIDITRLQNVNVVASYANNVRSSQIRWLDWLRGTMQDIKEDEHHARQSTCESTPHWQAFNFSTKQ
jgi:hypothetical protein